MTEDNLGEKIAAILKDYTDAIVDGHDRYTIINLITDDILTLIREAGYVKTKYSPKAIERVMNRLKGIKEDV